MLQLQIMTSGVILGPTYDVELFLPKELTNFDTKVQHTWKDAANNGRPKSAEIHCRRLHSRLNS